MNLVDVPQTSTPATSSVASRDAVMGENAPFPYFLHITHVTKGTHAYIPIYIYLILDCTLEEIFEFRCLWKMARWLFDRAPD